MTKKTVRTNTKATVVLTIELANLGSWGPGCQLDQVYRQAVVEAEGIVRKALGSHGRVVGVAKVKAITTDMEDRS